MSKLTKAQAEAELAEVQLAEARAYLHKVIDDAPMKKAAEERYYATVRECNFNDCMHFNADTGHCSLKICAYDLKEQEIAPVDDDDWDDWNWEDGGFEWVE